MVCRLIFLFLLMILLQNDFLLMHSEKLKRENLFVIRSINPMYGFPINQISYEFFYAFASISKQLPNEFTFRNIPSVLFEIEFYKHIKLPISIEIHNLELFGSFTILKEYFDKTIVRTYSETFRFKFIPISFTYFWYPLKTDFSSFFMFQLGLTLDKLHWQEEVESNFPDDPFQKSQIRSWNQFNPFFAFAVGVELPFDIMEDSSQFIESVFFASKFNFSYRRANVFADFAIEKPISSQVTILPFSIVFIIGLRFNSSSFFLN